jgi:hypothetical protein
VKLPASALDIRLPLKDNYYIFDAVGIVISYKVRFGKLRPCNSNVLEVNIPDMSAMTRMLFFFICFHGNPLAQRA